MKLMMILTKAIINQQIFQLKKYISSFQIKNKSKSILIVSAIGLTTCLSVIAYLFYQNRLLTQSSKDQPSKSNQLQFGAESLNNDNQETILTDQQAVQTSTSDTSNWLTYRSTNPSFQIDYPEGLEVSVNQYSPNKPPSTLFITTDPMFHNSDFLNIHIVPFDEDDKKLFLLGIAQQSIVSQTDNNSITTLPEGYTFFSNKKYSGYATDIKGVYTVYLLINDQIWSIGVKGDGEGSSYKENPNSIFVLNKMIESFTTNQKVNSQQNDPHLISPYIKNLLPFNSETNSEIIYAFSDLLRFRYPKGYSLEFSSRGINISDRQPESVPEAGKTLNIMLDEVSREETYLYGQNCSTEEFLAGKRFFCKTNFESGRYYITLSHKGKYIHIEYPHDQYQEIVDTIELQ